ncbi:MAG: tetratricopeptide repeat protein [candidate division WOR-3 bacterium]|nr:tetratricopeptide repeat protein [candidate division WOR-3 bacterium]
MAIKGSLVEASLPEVIQLLAYSLKSGCLSVTDGSNFGNIFLQDGKIVHATILKRDSRLGDSLLGRRLFDKNILKQALGVQKAKKKRIGEILVEMGAISRQILEEELKRQIEDAIFTMLTWNKGYFNFEEGLLPAAGEHTIQLSSKDLLLGSARRIPTWQEIQERLPPAGKILVAKEDGKSLELTESEERVLALTDGEKSIDEVVKKSGIDFHEACKAVYVLLTAGVIEEPKTRVEKKFVSGDEGEHRNMGLAYYQSTQYDEAENEFTEVLDDDPEDTEALFYLGMIALARGNDDSAKDYLERALQKERRVSILSNMGYLFIRVKLFKEAIDLLEEAQKLEPDNLKVNLNLSIARYNLGELDRADRGFQHVLSISEDLITPYLYLSLINVKKGDVKTAIALLSSAVERFPESAAFKNNLALLRESIEENETAESLYLEALLLQPGDNVLLKNIANLYYRLGLYGGALDYYEQIPENDRDARTSVRLGRVYLLKGDGNNALNQWKRAQALDPKNDRLRQEIEILGDFISV